MPLARRLLWLSLVAILVTACAGNQSAAVQPQSATPPSGGSSDLNARFVDPELDVDEWIGRFEVESREVYSARAEVLQAVGLRKGDRIADVGAGTGFYARLFADAVGSAGWVYAVEISPRFVEHINEMARKDGVSNITGVLSRSDSIMMPPESVDRVFLCDTYHHFEDPEPVLASIHRALSADGELVVVDFERIEGVSSEFIMNHVRAGKEVFRAEIEAAGFRLIEEVEIEGLVENYLLRFRKV